MKLDVVVTREDSGGEREVVMELGEAVSFKEVIDFREKFAKFTELGVGGLRKEIDELYRRAFASRGEDRERGREATGFYTLLLFPCLPSHPPPSLFLLSSPLLLRSITEHPREDGYNSRQGIPIYTTYY